MKFLTVLSLLSYQLSLAAASTIPTGLSKRAAQYNATLLAYGTSTDAWPVAYGLDDGKYIIAVVFIVRFEAKPGVLYSKTLRYSQPQ